MKRSSGLTAIAAAGLCVTAGSAGAYGNRVHNGGFENTTLTAPGSAYGTVPYWNFQYWPPIRLWFPGTADSPTDPNALWGPANGSANGLPATSPSGGKYIEQDANFLGAPFTQTINFLAPGHVYKLDFEWALGQWRYAANVGVTAQWTASLGTESYSTSVASIPAAGFSGWVHQTFYFHPTSATEVLSFLSSGSGDPPLALIDGVSLVRIDDGTRVPEPAAWTLMLVGLGALGGLARRRRRVAAA